MRHCLALIAEYARPSRRADLGPRLGRVGLARTHPAEHRRPRRRGRGPARLPGPRRRPLRGGVDRAARLAPGLPAAAGFDPQRPLTADAHHLVRAAARDLLTAEQRARRPARPPSTLAAASGIVAVHECAGPDIGGLDDWQELRDTTTASRSSATGVKQSPPPRRPASLIDDTGARGLAGDLFVDGALGSHTAWLHAALRRRAATAAATPTSTPTRSPPTCAPAPKRGSRRDSTSSATRRSPPSSTRSSGSSTHFGAPAVARCGHRLEHLEMVTAEQAARLGAWGVIASMQPNFDALWGGDHGMYAQRLGADRGSRLNPLALLASQGVPLAFGSDTPVTDMNPWATVRAATRHRTPGSAVSARAAFAAATRGAWRAGGVRDGVTGTLVPGAPASYAVWETDELEVSAPADAVQRWSTDPRSRVPALPRLGADDPLPRCGRPSTGVPSSMAKRTTQPRLGPCRRRHRHRSPPSTTSPSPIADQSPTQKTRTTRPPRPGIRRTPRSACMGQAVRRGGGRPAAPPQRRHRRRAAAVRELSAVRLVVPGDRRRSPCWPGCSTRQPPRLVGGFGYGFLFGLAFYIPLLPWISGLVGLVPWLALSLLEAVFPGVFGLLAVAVARRLTGLAGLVRRPLGARGMARSRRCRSVDSLGV